MYYYQPILKEDNRSRGSTLQFTKINVDSPLNSPHDLSKMSEFRDDLPTLLGDILRNENKSKIVTVESNNDGELEKTRSMYSVFNTPDNTDDEVTSSIHSSLFTYFDK